MNLVENADLVRQQVETARNKANRQDQVNVIAVTKYVDIATTEALVKTGIQHIGVNPCLLSSPEMFTWRKHLIGCSARF